MVSIFLDQERSIQIGSIGIIHIHIGYQQMAQKLFGIAKLVRLLILLLEKWNNLEQSQEYYLLTMVVQLGMVVKFKEPQDG